MVYLLWIIRLNIIISQVLPFSSFQVRSSIHRFRWTFQITFWDVEYYWDGPTGYIAGFSWCPDVTLWSYFRGSNYLRARMTKSNTGISGSESSGRIYKWLTTSHHSLSELKSDRIRVNSELFATPIFREWTKSMKTFITVGYMQLFIFPFKLQCRLHVLTFERIVCMEAKKKAEIFVMNLGNQFFLFLVSSFRCHMSAAIINI